MADEILSALQGMQQSPSETYWGIGQQALGQSLPKLIDPVYGDRGTNIGIALGGALVQGLLGYQARQEAAERNLQASQLANALIQLKTPEQRTSFISEAPTEFQSGLGTLATALTTAKVKQQLDAQKRIQEMTALGDFYQTPQGQVALEAERELSRARASGVNERTEFIQNQMNQRLDKANENREAMKILGAQLESQLQKGVLSPTEVNDISLATKAATDLRDMVTELQGLSLREIKQVQMTGISPPGHPGLAARLEELAQQYRKDQFGATLTGLERNAADTIFGDKLVASKDDVLSAFNSLSTKLYDKAESRLKTKAADIPTIYGAIQKAKQGERFTLPAPQAMRLEGQTIPSQPTTPQAAPTPAAPSNQSLIAQYEASLQKPNVQQNPQLKAKIEQRLKELRGQ